METEREQRGGGKGKEEGASEKSKSASVYIELFHILELLKPQIEHSTTKQVHDVWARATSTSASMNTGTSTTPSTHVQNGIYRCGSSFFLN